MCKRTYLAGLAGESGSESEVQLFRESPSSSSLLLPFSMGSEASMARRDSCTEVDVSLSAGSRPRFISM